MIDWLYAPVQLAVLPDTLTWLEALLLLVCAAGLAAQRLTLGLARRRRRAWEAPATELGVTEAQRSAGLEMAGRCVQRQWEYVSYVLVWAALLTVAALTTGASAAPRSPVQLLSLASVVLAIGAPLVVVWRDLRSAGRVDSLLRRPPPNGEHAP